MLDQIRSNSCTQVAGHGQRAVLCYCHSHRDPSDLLWICPYHHEAALYSTHPSVPPPAALRRGRPQLQPICTCICMSVHAHSPFRCGGAQCRWMAHAKLSCPAIPDTSILDPHTHTHTPLDADMAPWTLRRSADTTSANPRGLYVISI